MAEPAGEQQDNLIQRIHAKYDQLRNAEKTVAEYLLRNSNQRLDISITDFSNNVGVSEATISRFSRALGYNGYPDLKLSIAEGTNRSNRLVNLPSEIEQSDNLVEAGTKLANALSQGLRETNSTINHAAMEKAVDAVVKSNRLVFIGVGGAASICTEAMHLFAKTGRMAESISDGYSQVIAAVTLKSDDVLVGVSHTGQTHSVARALGMASEAGVPTISITSDPRSPVATAANISLTTWKSASRHVPLFGDFLEGRVCQLFLIDLLYLMVLFRSENGELENLQKTGQALENYYNRN